MKFSLTVMNTYRSDASMALNFGHPPRKMWDPAYGTQMFEEALNLAAVADEEGFDIVSVSEHHYQPGICNPNPAVTAAALLSVVKRAKLALLGPLASMSNPVRLAEEVAQLDQISGGRLIVCPLRGTPNEYKYYNINPDETRGRTEEATCLMLKALSEPEPFAWKSEYFDFPIVSVWPGPTQEPHPPFYFSANSEESARFAAEHRLGAAISFLGPKAVAQRFDFYRTECDANGWTPAPDQTLFRAFCAIGEDEAHGADLQARFDPHPPPAMSRGAASHAEIDKGFAFGMLQFAGSTEQVIEQIREHHELTGTGIYDLSFNAGYYSQEETIGQLRRFAREVIPQLRELHPVAA